MVAREALPRCLYLQRAFAVTARREATFAQVLQQAEMCTPDGAPVAWMLHRLGHAGQPRISGPDLMWRYCAWAAAHGDAIYLYGGSEGALTLLQQRLREAFPTLRIAGAYSPPMRPLSPDEDAAAVAAINASGAGTVWVGLGCPKQELWMHAHRDRIDAVMVGVGAAFDYHAGTLRRAPLWAQRAGLEWLFRLASEPRRLWRRYLVTNTLFAWAALRQLLSR
jgi:N-acetylglucosaminyldiphosphoundecaprenol N-acetyl-beta-D-mannosaminyltransferase